MKPSCLLVTILVLLCMLSVARCQSLVPTNPPSRITLAWDPEPPTNNITNYKIYWGPASGMYTNVLSAGTNTSATVTGLLWGAAYYFSATASALVGTNTLESTNSLPVWTNTPAIPTPPTVLRLIVN